MFGGYTSAAWSTSNRYISDATAFIFSLRRNGISYNDKFRIIVTEHAIISSSTYGPIFGDGFDIYAADNSNISTLSYSNFGSSYELPPGYIYLANNTRSFLAGSFRGWLTTEIEVFQLL